MNRADNKTGDPMADSTERAGNFASRFDDARSFVNTGKISADTSVNIMRWIASHAVTKPIASFAISARARLQIFIQVGSESKIIDVGDWIIVCVRVKVGTINCS